MCFMGDKQPEQQPKQRIDESNMRLQQQQQQDEQLVHSFVYDILTSCHKEPGIVDEVYCQILKQTTSNKGQS